MEVPAVLGICRKRIGLSGRLGFMIDVGVMSSGCLLTWHKVKKDKLLDVPGLPGSMCYKQPSLTLRRRHPMP
jgi:hypothetical protein